MAAINSLIYEQTKQNSSPAATHTSSGNKSRTGGVSTPHFHAQHQAGSFDSPSSSTATRLRAKERDRPGKNVSGSSISSSLCVQAKTGRPHQRERRRTKRRESYVRSTEGTSTGDEDTAGFGENYDGPTNRQCHLCPSPTDFAEKVNACRGNRSPSDLDADDEDNQDYDSTSMVSTLDPVPLSPQAGMMAAASTVNKATAPFGSSSHHENQSSFRTQFQKIRVAGMQKLADVGGESDTGALLSDSSRESDAFCKLSNATKLGQLQQQEKTALVQDLNEKEMKIIEMEKTIKDLNLRLRESEVEQEKLKLENQSLRLSLYDKHE